MKKGEYIFLLGLKILGFEPKKLDCGTYQGQAFNCNAQYVACGNSRYTTRAIAGVFYRFCAAGVFASCTSLLAGCHTAITPVTHNALSLQEEGNFGKIFKILGSFFLLVFPIHRVQIKIKKL